jgi:hypothetical protein
MVRCVTGLRTILSAVMCVIALLAPLTACDMAGARGATTASLTTDTSSAQFATDAEKIAFLRRYVTLYSAVETTEFHIVYHDNASGRIAGPSDWDMRVALKIAPADAPAWTSDLQEVSPAGIDLSWATDLPLSDSHWARTSSPRVYQRAGVIVAAFATEGIILKRIWTT